ncbi:MAG: hypothetical protein A4E72_02166 [Syntrophus sp. PtaU1.Bin208]|nr:MAG: hypothetical protein A4E72_02166 [Syntrophus sp. PtaU1.Bin208]
MKKSIVLMMLLSLALIISYGCASKDYVKQQIDPLVDRINKLEASSSSNASQVGDRLNKLEASSKTAQADAEKAKKDAAEALQISKDNRGQNEMAAERAEAAARKSEAAAKKAEKAFELHQKK